MKDVRRLSLLVGCAGALALGAAAGAGSAPADLCIPIGKLPPGVTFPGSNNPPGYVRLPPGVSLPGAVTCPKSAPTGTKKKSKAKPGAKATFAGTVHGALPPAPRSGRSGVMALRLPGGEVAAASWVNTAGRYSLTVPPGTYALVTWIADVRHAKFTEVASALVHAAAGAKRSLPLQTVLKKKRKAAAYRRTAGLGPPGFPTIPPPAGELWAAVDPFPQGSGEMAGFGEGMQGMLITDLVQQGPAAARRGCTVKVSGITYRVQDLVGEIERSESPAFDPGTRIPRGHWIEPNVEIRGTFSNSDAAQTATASVTVVKNGRVVGTATRTADYDNAFDLPTLLAKDIVNLICKEKPPTAYTGALDGTARLETGPGQTVLFTWKGTMELTAAGDAPAGPGGAPGTWRIFTVAGGSVHIGVSGNQGDCSVTGSADDPFGGAGQLAVRIDGDRPQYQPTLGWSGQIVPTTFAGSDSCKASVDLPLSEGSWALLDTIASSDTFTLEGTADRTIKPGFTEHTHWVFTPRSSSG
jgi:hypothetical protein